MVQYQPLYYDNDNGITYFYCAALARQLLFQYKLLALALNTHCIGITTSRTALLEALAHVTTPPDTLEDLCTSLLSRYDLKEQTSLTKSDYIESRGLYLLGKRYYEAY